MDLRLSEKVRESALSPLKSFARVNLCAGPCPKPLLQKKALVPRRIAQFPKDLVAELGIEARSLEAEGVDPGRMAAALERPRFRVGHELTSDPLAPQPVAHPQVADEQPAGIGLAREPRDDVPAPPVRTRRAAAIADGPATGSR